MSEIDTKSNSISIKKIKKKKVTIDETVSSFSDGRGGTVTITQVKSYGPEDGPIITELNGDMNEGVVGEGGEVFVKNLLTFAKIFFLCFH